MRRVTSLVLAAAVVVAVSSISLSSQSGIPTPVSVFGFEPGADNHEITYDQSVAYLQKLAAASKAIKLFEAGKTSQGRTYVFAVISTPENLSKLDRYREIAQRLAHPAGLTDEQAHQLAREGKAIVHIDGGLHSTERAGHQHMPLLTYDILRRANEPEMKAELENVILMLWPTINPDGQQMVAEWETTKGTDFGGLYQEYVGHDNNRDAYMMDMIESRVMEHTWRQWEPQIIHVHHQGAPAPSRIWFPPFAEPIATWAPPVISQEINSLGMAMALAEDENGHPGSLHGGRPYDAWYPGYIDYNPVFKNIAAYWTETAPSSIFPRPSTGSGQGGPGAPGGGGAAPGNGRIGGAGAATQQQATATPPAGVAGAGAAPANAGAGRQGGGRGGRGGMSDRPQSLYASPWPGGEWHNRDAVEYMETASLAVVAYAAKYKDDVLYDRYIAGRDQIARGKKEAPYAYLIPQDQRDPVAPVEMLRRLAFSGVRVSQLTAPVEIATSAIDGTQAMSTFPAGTWVIPADQEFIALAREVLDVQKYPEVRALGSANLDTPYDAAGWTLPLTMGVRVLTATSPLGDDVRAKMKLLGPMPDPKVKPTPYNLAANTATDAAPFDSVPGIGFDSSPNAAAIVPPAGKIRGTGPALAVDPAQNNAFRAVNRAWKQGASVSYLAGAPGSGIGARYVMTGLSDSVQNELVNSLALVADRMAPTGVALKKPRIGLFQGGSNGTQDEGWTRWLLEQYSFDFVSLHTADFHAPLRDKVDVILFAADGSLPGLAGGGRGGGGRGGGAAALTPEDLQAFEQFVRTGGTVVCFSGSCNGLINQFKLPVKNATAGLSNQEYVMNGSVLEVTTTPSHQVMAGMPEYANIFVDRSPVFDTTEGFKGTILAKYQDTGSPLRSGFLLGEKYVNGKAAAIDVELDNGHVVLIGFQPQWRGQPFGTFRVIFNALLYWR